MRRSDRHPIFSRIIGALESVHEWWDRNSRGTRGIVLYAIAGVIAAVILNSVFGTLLGTSFPVVTVSSTSMVPTLNVGDLVIIEGRENYTVGEIIVFKGWESKPIIHRVVAKYENDDTVKLEGWDELTSRQIKEKANGRDIYITRGDANPSCDQCGGGRPPVTPDQIYGRSVFHVPYLGYVKLYAVRYLWSPLTGG